MKLTPTPHPIAVVIAAALVSRNQATWRELVVLVDRMGGVEVKDLAFQVHRVAEQDPVASVALRELVVGIGAVAVLRRDERGARIVEAVRVEKATA